MLDDVTSSLDNKTTFNIINNIKNNEFWNKKTYVFVTNNLSLLEYADRVMCVNKGRVIYLGDYQTLQNTPQYQDIYALAQKVDQKEIRFEEEKVRITKTDQNLDRFGRKGRSCS